MTQRAQSTVTEDWADAFVRNGWTAHHHFTTGLGGRRDWVVVELTVGAKPGTVAYRVLYAPEFLYFADAETREQILDAIRARPAQLAASFETEKQSYLEQGLSNSLIAQLMPRREPLRPTSFRWPVLVMSRDPASGSLMLLGSPITFNLGFAKLLARDNSEIDEGLALMILMTCRAHEKAFSPTRGLKLTLTQPFHPRRLAQIAAAKRQSGSGMTLDEQRSDTLQTLHRHVPRTVESLRTNPPRRGTDMIAVLRSRLAESVSDEVFGRPERKRIQNPRIRWEARLATLTATQREHVIRLLSRAEREEVDALVARRASKRQNSTRRVLLARAHAKLTKILRADKAESV